MPIDITTTAGGGTHASPFVGPTDFRATVPVTPSGLTTAEVDEDGVLKVGTPLKSDGTLADGTVGEFIFGCVAEDVKVAASNVAGDLAAASAIDVAVVTIGQVNRAILEDNLGRALTANELAAIAAAGSHLALVQ